MQKIKPLIYLFLCLLWLVLLYIGPGQSQGCVLSIVLLAFSVFQIINSLSHKQIWLGVMFFFMLSYSYEPVRYFCYGDPVCYWRQVCQSTDTVYNVAMCVLLFQLAMCYFINYQKAIAVYRKDPFIFKSDVILWGGCLLLGIALTLIGKSGDNMFISGGYGHGNRQVSSTFEYAQIPLIIALCYSYTRERKIITFVFISLYILKDLLYGGRIETVMIALLAYMVFLRYKFSFRKTAIVVFIGFFFLTIWGSLRHDTNQQIENVTANAWNALDLSTGNSQDVYYASMRILYMIKYGILSSIDCVLSFIYFLLSSFVPYSELPSLANLASYMNRIIPTGGGGLAPVFIYAWTGYIGVLVVGIFVGKILTQVMRGTCGKYLFFYGIFLMAYVPRWYAYYPISIIKLCVYATIFFMVTESIRTRKLPFLRK